MQGREVEGADAARSCRSRRIKRGREGDASDEVVLDENEKVVQLSTSPKASQLGAVVATVVVKEVGRVLEQLEEDHAREARNDIVVDDVTDVVVGMVDDVVNSNKDGTAEETKSSDAKVQQGDIVVAIVVIGGCNHTQDNHPETAHTTSIH